MPVQCPGKWFRHKEAGDLYIQSVQPLLGISVCSPTFKNIPLKVILKIFLKKIEKCKLKFKYNYSVVNDISSKMLSSTHTTQGSVGPMPYASPQKPKKYEDKIYLLI